MKVNTENIKVIDISITCNICGGDVSDSDDCLSISLHSTDLQCEVCGQSYVMPKILSNN